MVLIGLISYPLYLWHWPILTFPRMIRGAEPSINTRIAGVLLSFALAWLTWRFVEKPIRFGRKTWIRNTSLVSVSVLIGAFGYAAHQDGFLQRFPNFTTDFVPIPSPEPASLAIMGTGLAGLTSLHRRKAKR